MEGGSLGVSHPLGGSLTQGGSAAAESPTATSESSESSGLDPAHREDLNSTYFFTHRRGSFCRAAIRDRRSSTYSWALARNPEMTWLVRRSLMQTISSWQRMTCPLMGTLTNRASGGHSSSKIMPSPIPSATAAITPSRLPI